MLDKELGRYNKIDSVVYDEAGVTVTADGKEHRFCMTECAQGKCYGCTMPTAQLADTLAGAPTTVEGTPGTPPELALLDPIPAIDPKKSSKIKYLQVAPMFAEAIERIYQEISISKLFR